MSSKRHEMREKRQKQKSQQMAIWIGLAAIVLVLLIVLFIQPLFEKEVDASGLSRGDPNAPVKVVAYADFQCPGCQAYFLNTEPTLITDYIDTGKIYYTYTPVAFIGQESIDAAEAAYCANEQGKFWEYHDILFQNQTGENIGDFSEENLNGFAQQLGLDMDTFQTCTAANSYNSILQQNMQTWTAAGLSQTPSFTVNGKGVLYAGLQTSIDQALAGQ